MIIDMSNSKHVDIALQCKSTFNGESLPHCTFYLDDEKGILKHCLHNSKGVPIFVWNENQSGSTITRILVGNIEIQPPEGITKDELKQILNQ